GDPLPEPDREGHLPGQYQWVLLRGDRRPGGFRPDLHSAVPPADRGPGQSRPGRAAGRRPAPAGARQRVRVDADLRALRVRGADHRALGARPGEQSCGEPGPGEPGPGEPGTDGTRAAERSGRARGVRSARLGLRTRCRRAAGHRRTRRDGRDPGAAGPGRRRVVRGALGRRLVGVAAIGVVVAVAATLAVFALPRPPGAEDDPDQLPRGGRPGCLPADGPRAGALPPGGTIEFERDTPALSGIAIIHKATFTAEEMTVDEQARSWQ